MLNRRPVTVLLVAGAVLILTAALLYVFFQEEGMTAPPPTPVPTLPALEVTLPPSLADLAEQYPELASVLNDPELDTVYKELLVAYQEGGEEAVEELARQRGLLTPDGDVRVTLVLDTEDHGPLVDQLQAAGVTVVSAYGDRVNIAVPLEQIEAQLQTGEPGAIFEELTELEHVIAVRLPERRVPDAGGVEGEGVAVIGADHWHSAGISGEGVRIGILDLGFADHQTLTGVELPDRVVVRTFGLVDSYEVHGTACAEIIHDIAPGAELFLAWYDGSDAAMGEAVDWLLDQGVQVVSHSAGGLIGPRDGSEWDARLVDRVAAQGVVWVNSAGNEALSHYRGTFTDEDNDGFHEFAPGEELLGIYPDTDYIAIALSWEDDWDRPERDYDLFLYDAAGNVLASSQDPQSGWAGQEPVEWIEYATDGAAVYAVVTGGKGGGAETLDLFVAWGDVAHPSPDHSLCPPGDAVGSLTVGAVNWEDDTLADYSSRGPTGDGRLKPEISAPTGVSGATYGRRQFAGTSASAPHVAGAAALVWQAYPEFDRQEVVDFLLANAVDLGPPGPDTGFGYGRLQLPAPPEAAAGVATPSVGSPVPLKTPSPVAYVTPAPPSPSAGPGLLVLTSLGLVVGGLACAGVALLLIGLVGVLALRRRTRAPRPPGPRPASSPPPPPQMPPPQAGPRRCRYCGAELREAARFCPRCGRPTQ